MSRTRLRKEGAPLKLISTGRPSKGAEPFLGARSHLLGEYHGNSQRGPQLSELSFSSARSEVAGQVFLLCGVSYSLSRSLAHSSASPFLSLHDTVLALFTREAVRRLQRASVCGKMLPDNTGVCDSEGKLISPGTKREYKTSWGRFSEQHLALVSPQKHEYTLLSLVPFINLDCLVVSCQVLQISAVGYLSSLKKHCC